NVHEDGHGTTVQSHASWFFRNVCDGRKQRGLVANQADDLAKKANLTTPTVWLGRLVRLARTGAYEWHDGAIGRQADGFREPPSGTELCLTMWLDFDRPEGSWNEWDCGYASGYSALCKKSLKKPAFSLSSIKP
ncbi:hypothetical protein ANCDUO_12075, partial [Ancylostoma duodenale]